MELLGRHTDGVRSVAVSADGRWAASGGREGHIKVWEIPPPLSGSSTRKKARSPPPAAMADFEAHRGVVFSLCMSPDARVLVSGGSDRFVRVWDFSLVVYARRMALNRLRALWSTGRVRRARPKRTSSSSSLSGGSGGGGGGGGGGGSGPSGGVVGGTGGAGGGGGGLTAFKAFGGSREQRQQVLESLFALPDIIYAKVLMYV